MENNVNEANVDSFPYETSFKASLQALHPPWRLDDILVALKAWEKYVLQLKIGNKRIKE